MHTPTGKRGFAHRLMIGIAIAGVLALATGTGWMSVATVRAQLPGQLRVSAGGPYTGVVGQPVLFSAQIDLGGRPPGTQITVQWSFGDGGIGFGQTTSHVYTAPGTYTVTVTATGGGGFAMDSTIATIGGGGPLPGQLTVQAGGPYTGQVGQPIVFTAQVGLGGRPPGTPVQVQWDFGDGTTGFGETTSHTYAASGTYTVTVTASVGPGQMATAITAAIISGGQPVAQVNPGGPYTGVVGQPVAFSGTITGVPPGQVGSFLWSFGDGTTGSGATTSHIYTAPGTYTVTLTVTTTLGQQLSATTTATITGGGMPAGMTEMVQLFPTCNNVALTWPVGTAMVVVAGAITPANGLVAIWWFNNAAQSFVGFSPQFPMQSDLTMVSMPAQPVFICMNTPGTLTRPVI
jgi:PKD repeat protein